MAFDYGHGTGSARDQSALGSVSDFSRQNSNSSKLGRGVVGLIDRIWQVIRANINSMVAARQDPEKVMDKALMDMQEDLIRVRQAVAQAIATEKRTERKCKQVEATAQKWQQRAQLALQKGDENLARDALVRRKPYIDTALLMNQQITQQSSIVSKLKLDLQALEHKIAEVRAKKDMYVARLRSAKASEQIHEIMGKINTRGSESLLERMEDKVHQMEASAQVMAGLEGGDDLDKRFATLEAGSDVDGELASLKKQLQGTNGTSSLPPEEGRS